MYGLSYYTLVGAIHMKLCTWSVVRMRRRSSKRCHVHRGCSYTGASSSISVGKGPFDVALVEFKRSKEVVPYTGIQEAAFQDV